MTKPMMKIIKILLVLFFFSICSFFTFNAHAKSEVVPLMQSNFEGLLKLQEIISSPQNFAKPSQQKKAHQIIKKLKKTSHNLPESLSQQKGILQIGKIFRAYLEDIDRNFSKSDLEYIRFQLMTVSNFCYECHTSMSTNYSFKDINHRVKKLKLSPLETAEFYVATRQFDQAQEKFENIILDKNFALQQPNQWIKALREYMDLNIRARNNSASILNLILQKIDPSIIPIYFKNHYNTWKKDLISWSKEDNIDKDSSAKKLLSKSRQLLDTANKRHIYPSKIKSDVLYLRVINYLNLALSKKISKKNQAEAFYLLAIANNSLETKKLWNLDNYYLQSCIEIYPHSSEAKNCFELLLSEIYFSYSGSSGTNIPEDEIEKLNKYKDLAQ